MASWLLLLCTVLGQAGIEENLPAPLRRAMEARQADTSQIKWTYTHLDDREYGLVERITTQTVGDTLWQANIGDENGFHRTTYRSFPNHPIPQEDVAGTWNLLVYEGDIWAMDNQAGRHPVSGNATPCDQRYMHHPVDFRWAGINPWWGLRTSSNVFGLDRRFVDGFENAKLNQTVSGDIEIITATYGEHTLEWQLDRRRGGQPILAALYVGDQLAYSSQTDLQEVQGRWIPSAMKFYYKDEVEPKMAIDIQEASFDKPEHKKDISPTDIGALAGTQIGYPGKELLRWDGTQLITGTEYDELEGLYGFRPDPIIIKRLAAMSKMTAEEFTGRLDQHTVYVRARYFEKRGEEPWLVVKTGEKDEWDVYVAEFIKKHKLDEARTKRAERLLKQSKKLRDYHMLKNRSKIRSARAKGDIAKAEHYEAVKEHIFKNVLVRGLKLLPEKKKKG